MVAQIRNIKVLLPLTASKAVCCFLDFGGWFLSDSGIQGRL